MDIVCVTKWFGGKGGLVGGFGDDKSLLSCLWYSSKEDVLPCAPFKGHSEPPIYTEVIFGGECGIGDNLCFDGEESFLNFGVFDGDEELRLDICMLEDEDRFA
ncbi:unnamed protein product [Meganyctiphanes norvegica]|uniref:Uncharacterized protein n=1 Tax=Meganyctiphanes norvegica TaxID=48144 RepID=A0AAV2RN64_MEGNR